MDILLAHGGQIERWGERHEPAILPQDVVNGSGYARQDVGEQPMPLVLPERHQPHGG